MKDNKVKICASIFGLGCIISFLSIVYYKFIPKMSLKKYTQACLYLAVMDDEICRNELEGEFVDGKEISFPKKRESLQYRYRLFLDMYKTYSKRKLEKLIKEYEIRLEESRD